MAENTVSTAFITHFVSEAHVAYQQRASRLRTTCRTEGSVNGDTVTWQKIGTGVATTKSRNGQIAPMNPSHTNVSATMQDTYTGQMVDILDLDKINIDEVGILGQAGAMAQGRKTDEIILTALDATANANNVTATTFTNVAGPIKMMEVFGNSSVPLGDDQAYAVVCWEAWGDLLDLDEFSNADYIGNSSPLVNLPTAKRWLGFVWFPHENLQLDGTGDKKQFFYHRSGIGHAIGHELTPDVTWQGKEQGWWLATRMSQAAKIIDDTAVIEHIYDIT